MTREGLLLEKFLDLTNQMEVDPLLVDKFMHDGFYETMASVYSNMDKLDLFLTEHYKHGIQGFKNKGS